MSNCCLDLARKIALRCENDNNIKDHNWTIQELNSIKKNESFYFKAGDAQQLKERPWKMDPNYFKKVYISSISVMKMALHARSGGSIEIMGMLTGKIINNSLVVMDVYPLPVEGTETRVNAQAEGYEYMVQYLEGLKQINRNENIVGWYHSHPGYGCWLSGIDVATQALNQNFQDPYLAIVIDPVKSAKQNKIEIGAFRTYPDSYKQPANNSNNQQLKKVPHSKRNDFGIHAAKYYALEVEIFKSSIDEKILNFLENKSWVSNIIQSNSAQEIINNEINLKILNLLDSFKVNEGNMINAIERLFSTLFDKHFEASITQKLLELDYRNSEKTEPRNAIELTIDSSECKKESETNNKEFNAKINGNEYEEEEEEEEDNDEDNEEQEAEVQDEVDDDESDLDDIRSKATTLDFSDADDAISVESSSAIRNEDEGLPYENAENSNESRLEIPVLPRREMNKRRTAIRDTYTKIYRLRELVDRFNRVQPEENLVNNTALLGKSGGENNESQKRSLRSRHKLNSSLSTSNLLAKDIGSSAFQEFIVLDTQERLFLGR